MTFLCAYPLAWVKICDMSKFTTIDAFFVNVNKSSVSAIVPEQSESASLVEIHYVDVPTATNRESTVLSPTIFTTAVTTSQDSVRWKRTNQRP